MLLQPLAELVDGGSGGRLWVDATLREGSLVLVVRGETPAVASVDPVLGDLRQRLSRVYGHDCALEVERAGDTSVASLVIPAVPAWREVA
jgi:hypothetical protein